MYSVQIALHCIVQGKISVLSIFRMKVIFSLHIFDAWVVESEAMKPVGTGLSMYDLYICPTCRPILSIKKHYESPQVTTFFSLHCLLKSNI